MLVFHDSKYSGNGGNEALVKSCGFVKCNMKARYSASVAGNPLSFLSPGDAKAWCGLLCEGTAARF